MAESPPDIDELDISALKALVLELLGKVAELERTVGEQRAEIAWPIAMLGFSTAAWKLAPRDRFIGWTPELREKNLPLVVDNPRFLILPWIAIPNLGSHILSLPTKAATDSDPKRPLWPGVEFGVVIVAVGCSLDVIFVRRGQGRWR